MIHRTMLLTKLLSYPYKTALISSCFANMSKPLTLYHFPTPNGQQPAVLLEELKVVNPAVDYE